MSPEAYCKTPYRDTSYETMVGTKSEGLEDIRALSYSTVDSDTNLALGDRGTFTKRIKRSSYSVQLPPAMVRDDYSVNLVLNCQGYIFCRVY